MIEPNSLRDQVQQDVEELAEEMMRERKRRKYDELPEISNPYIDTSCMTGGV